MTGTFGQFYSGSQTGGGEPLLIIGKMARAEIPSVIQGDVLQTPMNFRLSKYCCFV